MIENCTSPPSQMIAKQSDEKRKGPFLINMWEVDFPCKAGLLRRKVCVRPLCTDGPVKAGLVLQAALFAPGIFSLQRESPYRCKDTCRRRKMGLYVQQCV